ncbi:uncharacterized protein Z519_05435 [Cladophialophora bantiana CBS 173.52]|uniref:Laccase n=1 Tax=Cladophialophora bantiana (strain ATCC 10958 / CBS 173.52 / CDC B-1940 / NIH 8579) TaxID=1442370 RepID=A0A0D2IBB4_CLAB1|nr:uncharacterized protein Z519_05435 [Cladophialophora bantiana CBS 173.52]KIW94119.1 hypothetical protein Z519_05435 [Cladophialophora bantiana CBS 173.52]
MAPIRALWTGIVYFFDFLTNSPSQLYSSEITPNLQVPVQPIQPQATRYPIFNPPDDLEDVPFRCEYPDYPEHDGWVSCNTKVDRQCWLKNTKTGERFDIATDYENKGPKGIVRHYYLELEESDLNPDGFANLSVQLFNKSLPGPRIQACWGDQVRITIKNKLTGSQTADDPGNGTTIHWHGFRQWHTGYMDGVNAVTQCPIAPNSSFTYIFNITQYGTSWYHSHYSLQYAAGALGPLTVYGPTSKNYDHQLYPVIMTDWLHQSVYQKWDASIQKSGKPIFVDNILQNGIEGTSSHIYPLFVKVCLTRKQGVKYLMRLINGAADTTFVFSIDDHKFWVISTDFVAIEPYYTDHVVVGIGQRYNIIVDANPERFTYDQSYWIRTTPAKNCSSFNTSAPIPDERTGIVRYTFSEALPSTSRHLFEATCADETYYRNITPIVHWTVGHRRQEMDPLYLTFQQMKGYPYWPCDKTVGRFELVPNNPMWLNFSGPTLWNLDQNFTDKGWLAVVDTNDTSKEEWIQLTIISGPKKSKAPLLPHPVPKVPGIFVPGQHPIHLHGHDFAVLDQCVPDSTTECDVSKASLTLNNPPRRDVAFLPNGGYLIVAFRADNPGVWIMHCHIAFHASSGLAVQIVENRERISIPPFWGKRFKDMCKGWDDWSPKIHDPSDPCGYLIDPGEEPLQTDSGI